LIVAEPKSNAPSEMTALTAFAAGVSARLDGMERWLERVSILVERLAENRERVAVMEARIDGELAAVKSRVAAVEAAAAAADTTDRDQEKRLAVNSLVIQVAIYLAGLITSGGVALIFARFGG
jgi:hypothetical protein